MAQPFWKVIWPFLAKLNILLPYNPAVKLLGISSNVLKLMSTQKPAHGFLQKFIHNCQNLETNKLFFSR